MKLGHMIVLLRAYKMSFELWKSAKEVSEIAKGGGGLRRTAAVPHGAWGKVFLVL